MKVKATERRIHLSISCYANKLLQGEYIKEYKTRLSNVTYLHGGPQRVIVMRYVWKGFSIKSSSLDFYCKMMHSVCDEESVKDEGSFLVAWNTMNCV